MCSLDIKISIITVTYNCEKTVAASVESVKNQDYRNVEYLVIDGGSRDGTLDILSKYEHFITYMVSEPDRGIYHAMNKGITAATGDYIYFLNSGDILYGENVISKLCSYIKQNNYPELIYGNIYLLDPFSKQKRLNGKRVSFADLKLGAMICHQSIFVKSQIYTKYGMFNEKYKIAADFEFLLKCFKEKECISYVPLAIATYPLDGISSRLTTMPRLLNEKREIIKTYFPGITYWIYSIKHYYHLLKTKIRLKL